MYCYKNIYLYLQFNKIEIFKCFMGSHLVFCGVDSNIFMKKNTDETKQNFWHLQLHCSLKVGKCHITEREIIVVDRVEPKLGQYNQK